MKNAVRRILLMSALLGPGAAFALGLGEIKLNSALNQPFDAEIELVAATQEDLGALRAALASSETFVRYGLDRPSYLVDFNFRVAKGSGGRDVLRVTSPRPVTEPFVTLLVEANWPRGRLLREYTVLLDPPVYAPGPAASEPVAAAPGVASGGATTARAAAPVETMASEPVRAPREPRAASITPGSEYRVRRNDTLWEIASAANPGSRSDVNRAMVSIFQTNPDAFDGNINVLRSGSTLRIPDSSQIRSISATEASAEVARQYDAWRTGRTSAAAAPTATTGATAATDTGRLRLVPPQQGTAAPSTGTAPAPAAPAESAAAAAAGSSDLESRVQQLEGELAEARRLLEVRNAELATLQGGTPTPVDGASAPTDAATPPGATPAEAAPAAAIEPKKDQPEQPKADRPAEPPAPSLLERIADYWWVLLGLLALGLGALLFQRTRRERGSAEESLEEALGSREARSNMRFSPRPRDEDILVEEKRGSDTPRAAVTPAAAATLAEPVRRVTTVSDTLSGEGAASLESGDPLAEADFHMAYGLYDQAADLVQLAMKREPQRRDLKLKLLEIYFVWGNKDKFLELARDLNTTRGDAPGGEWDKVLIMGKQIASGDALFSGNLTAGSSDSLDMELHGSPGTLDLEIPAGESRRPDMDFTGSATEMAPLDRSGIDFILDEPVRGTDESSVLPTIEMPQIRSNETGSDTQELTVDRLGLDLGTLRGLESLESLDANDAVDARQQATSDTIETAAAPGGKSLLDDDSEDLLGSTALMRMTDDDTSLLPRDESLEGVVDLSDATGELPAIDSTSVMTSLNAVVDYDLGGEPATMSEVGTKLDLARAYMDMGDPEGARSILDEVLQEGNPTQRNEAERLIASLP